MTKQQKEKVFWILWNSEGRTPPTARFSTFSKAMAMAESMQKDIGVGTMYVLKAENKVCVTKKVIWEGLKP